MEKSIRQHLGINNSDLLVVTAPPGVGKSTIASRVSEQVAEHANTLIAWFGTRHDQFDAVTRSPTWRHMEGRHGDLYDAEADTCSPENCKWPNAAHVAGRKGWRVADQICSPAKSGGQGQHAGRSCSIPRDDCRWWQQWDPDVHRFMPSQHIYLASLWDRPDLRIVFDELDSPHFTPEAVQLKLNTIGEWLRAWPFLTNILDPLLAFVGQYSGDYLADAPLYKELAPILPGLKTDCLSPPDDDAGLSNPDEWADALPDGHAKEFLAVLDEELKRYLKGERFVSRIAVHRGAVILFPPPKLPERLFCHPAVLINATADTAALGYLLANDNYEVKVYSPDVELYPETTVHYVLDANHSKAALKMKSDTYSQQWFRRVREAVSGSRRALVVATIEGEKMLGEALADLVSEGKIVLGHYGALSGLNEYKECEVAVLSQPFNPPPAAVAGLYRRIYGGTTGAPLDLRTCYRRVTFPWSDGDGMSWEVSLRSMVDARLAPIYENWRQAEMYQAAHRVRPILGKRRIVVLCAVPIAGLAPTSVTYSRKGRTLDRLREVARRLLMKKESVSCQDIAQEAQVDVSTVRRNWQDLLRLEGLRGIEVRVPSARYPGGRATKAATR